MPYIAEPPLYLPMVSEVKINWFKASYRGLGIHKASTGVGAKSRVKGEDIERRPFGGFPF